MVEVPRLSLASLRELRSLVDASAYLHCLRRERLGRVEAMMEGDAQLRQLDLLELATTAIQRQRLDPMMRTELTGLLKLLIGECSAGLAKAKEADDE